MKSGRRFGMLRKVCAVAVASVLAAGCLTACGSSKNTGPLTLDQIKENGKLTVATEAAYEPFEYMDGDKIIGYNADLFAKICDDLGVELDYIDLPFQGILAGLEAKKYDVVGATLGVTAERAGKYTMTYPIQNGTTVFVKRKGDDSIKSIEDMSGKKVGTDTWVSWAVRKEDTELSDYINSEIHKFKEDGTLAELQKKWFGEAVDLPESDYIPAE